MMEFSPETASKILKVAKCVANIMLINYDVTNKENLQCESVEFLVHLGEILAKAVPGCQDVDTTNCKWNELPTIPTDKEILTGKHVINHLFYYCYTYRFGG